MNKISKTLYLGLICLFFTACKAQDNRELNIYLESAKHGYFAVAYKKENCNNENQKLDFYIDSSGVFKTTECFVSSNIINKHHFYVRIENDYKEIGYQGRGYSRNSDSLYVLGVKTIGAQGWDFMIYKLGTLDELSEPITENSKDLQEFEDNCINSINRKNQHHE